jgi:hypothetical protein
MSNNIIAGLLWLGVSALLVYRIYRKRRLKRIANQVDRFPMSDRDGTPTSFNENPQVKPLWSRAKAIGAELLVNAIITYIAAIPLAFMGGFLEGLFPYYESEIRTGISGILVLLFFALMSLPLAFLAFGAVLFGLPGILVYRAIDWDAPLTPLVLVKLSGLVSLVLLGSLWSIWCWRSWREERKWMALFQAAQDEAES